MRRKCVEIDKDVLKKLYKDFTDEEIAKIFNTNKICVLRQRLKYNLRKYGKGSLRFNKLIDNIINALKEKCFLTYKDLASLNVRSRDYDLVFNILLSSYDVKLLFIKRLGSRYSLVYPRSAPRMFIYLSSCEDKLAVFLVDNIRRIHGSNVNIQMVKSWCFRNNFSSGLIDKILDVLRS